MEKLKDNNVASQFDYGGRTNKGITQNTYNSWLKAHGKASKDVKSITDSEVEQIY